MGVVLGATIAFVAVRSQHPPLPLPLPLPAPEQVYLQPRPEFDLRTPEPSVTRREPTLPSIATRGVAQDYAQVGILTKRDEDPDVEKAPTILPLFGRTTYPGSQQWHYYAASDKFHVAKLPVVTAKRECSKDPGCPQLWDGDVVRVPAYKSEFEVTMYNT